LQNNELYKFSSNIQKKIQRILQIKFSQSLLQKNIDKNICRQGEKRNGETFELYKIDQQGQIAKMEKAPFSDEPKELEDFIMKNEEILGDVALLGHQIKLPDGKRIDIWGVDLFDLCPLIIELKNVTVGLEAIPQVLPYYTSL